MHLSVRFFAGLRERAGTDEIELDDLPDSLDVEGLKRALEARLPQLGSLDHVRGVLENTYVADDSPLHQGCVVSLLPPVSGGAPEGEAPPDGSLELGILEISSEALVPADCQARVTSPACGATVLFTGSTRGTNRGQEVTRLDYEAFAEMAGVEMRRIFDECLGRFGPGEDADPDRLLRMLCQHRTGTVGVGEPSVVVAVASPHRAPAFEAARFLIDELKARVPLWKKEVYEGGHHWIGDRS